MAKIKVKVEDAVGMVLGHDVTKIVPNEYKGPLLKKGHIIQAEDIKSLKSIGKEHIYLIELTKNQVHENDAVLRMAAAVAGSNVYYKEPSEGRVNLYSQISGLLKINRLVVNEINMIDNAILSTLHSNKVVAKDELLAGIKVVPLVVEETTVAAVEEIARNYASIVTVIPFLKLRVGVIITGNEVFFGRTQDRFGKVFSDKAARYGFTLAEVIYKPDDMQQITDSILKLKQTGIDLIVITGGMSVDPDDVTPDAIRSAGAEVVTYGTPVLPGAMFMIAYIDGIPIMGLPACGMYAKITIFDLVLPRILAGEKISRKDIMDMGYGGLCMACPSCTFPHCPFGK